MSIEDKKKLKEVGENENLYTFIGETHYTFPNRTDVKSTHQVVSDSLDEVLSGFESFLRCCGFILDGKHLELVDNE